MWLCWGQKGQERPVVYIFFLRRAGNGADSQRPTEGGRGLGTSEWDEGDDADIDGMESTSCRPREGRVRDEEIPRVSEGGRGGSVGKGGGEKGALYDAMKPVSIVAQRV